MQLTFDRAAFESESRLATWIMANCVINLQKDLYDGLKMKPSELLVWLVVAVACIQRMVRSRPLPPEYKSNTVGLPQELVTGISRRAIAQATGLPRETVRRIVGHFLEDGRFVEQRRDRIATRPATLASENVLELPALMIHRVTILVNELIRLGVLGTSKSSDPKWVTSSPQRSRS